MSTRLGLRLERLGGVRLISVYPVRSGTSESLSVYRKVIELLMR